jgi:4-alpha-glucanotransferase
MGRTPRPPADGERGWAAGAPRSSGVLLHPASLPGGRLGPEAYRFVDWLAEAGGRWWQVLPLGPPDRWGSPYAGASAFAGSPALLARPRAGVRAAEVADFRERHRYWADDWARFAGRDALAHQVRFEREWGGVRAHAAARGVALIGDIPIFVADRSADVRAHPELFRRDVVAGVPPDLFTADGQLWGNPVYDWRAMAADGFRWWTERLRRTFELVDVARLDHFRALVAYWGVPAGARTARTGSWRRGPGDAVVVAARRELGSVRLVAEDLGVITPAVERLRRRLGLPGIRVLQFGFDGGARNPHAPGNVSEDVVCYPGTHDNDTAAGWWAAASAGQRRRAARALAAAGIEEQDPAWALLRLALSTRARIAVVPAQDLLSLGSEARMNRPGTRRGNWAWRLPPHALDRRLAERLREASAGSGRA